jgi:hypothetical protein
MIGNSEVLVVRFQIIHKQTGKIVCVFPMVFGNYEEYKTYKENKQKNANHEFRVLSEEITKELPEELTSLL